MHPLIRFLFVAILTLSAASRPASGQDAAKAASTGALQGKWQLVSTEERGEAKRYANRSLVFAGNEYRFYVKALLVRKAVVTVDASVEPHTMDLLQQIGPTNGLTGKCIFKVQDDLLTIAQGIYGKQRPSTFDTRDGACSSVTVWKRQDR